MPSRRSPVTSSSMYVVMPSLVVMRRSPPRTQSLEGVAAGEQDRPRDGLERRLDDVPGEARGQRFAVHARPGRREQVDRLGRVVRHADLLEHLERLLVDEVLLRVGEIGDAGLGHERVLLGLRDRLPQPPATPAKSASPGARFAAESVASRARIANFAEQSPRRPSISTARPGRGAAVCASPAGSPHAPRMVEGARSGYRQERRDVRGDAGGAHRVARQDKSRLFRREALERLDDIDELDHLVTVTHPRAWLALGAVAALIVVALAWASFGTARHDGDRRGHARSRGGRTLQRERAAGRATGEAPRRPRRHGDRRSRPWRWSSRRPVGRDPGGGRRPP